MSIKTKIGKIVACTWLRKDMVDKLILAFEEYELSHIETVVNIPNASDKAKISMIRGFIKSRNEQVEKNRIEQEEKDN